MDGYEALRDGAAWIDLSARGKIRVTGEDRARLLHAMSTNHIQGLARNHGLYAFFLNEKGRVLADAFVYNLGEALFLDTEPETRRTLFDHLDRYIIADDVTLEDESERLTSVGLEGPQSLAVAAAAGIRVPQEKDASLAYGAGFTARVSSTGAEGLRLFVPTDQRDGLIERLQSAGARAATSEEARVVRLEHGIPRYGEDLSERHLAQETQVTHAIHTNKGCYLGQEIVERVRSRGQVHRLLTPIRISSQTPPPPGTKITSSGVEVGEISSAAFSRALQEVVGMAYVRTESAQHPGDLVVAHSEPAIRVSTA